MGTSERLRIADVEEIYRLINECRELGDDPRAWRRHLVRALCRMTGCRVGESCEVRPTADGLITDWRTVDEIGRDESERRRAIAYLTEGDHSPDAFCVGLARRYVGGHETALTRSRRQLIDDPDWARSETCEAYRQLGVADIVMSLCAIPDTDRAVCVSFSRGAGERRVGARAVGLIGLVCRLVQPYLGRALARSAEPGVLGLSPRRRQVLAGLLEGRSEKQVARALGLRPATVHEYVTDLYRHFDVGSRGELLARFLWRRAGPADAWLERLRSEGRDDTPDPTGRRTGRPR